METSFFQRNSRRVHPDPPSHLKTAMKTSHLATLSAAAFALCTLLVSSASAQTDPSVPTGTLTAYPTIVRTGTYPTLTWGINFPATVTNVVTINPGGDVTPVTGTTMDVRVLGASVIEVWLDYWGNVIKSQYVPVEAQCAVSNNSSKNQPWGRIFYGTLSQVNPSTVVFSTTLVKQSNVQFGGRYYADGCYGTFVNTFGSNNNNTNNVKTILALKNGDCPPSSSPLYGQPTITSFLQPYMNATTKQISIGPKDIIYLFELTHTDPSNPGFDLQDLVLLCTFR
jgi:hypothetical protein